MYALECALPMKAYPSMPMPIERMRAAAPASPIVTKPTLRPLPILSRSTGCFAPVCTVDALADPGTRARVAPHHFRLTNAGPLTPLHLRERQDRRRWRASSHRSSLDIGIFHPQATTALPSFRWRGPERPRSESQFPEELKRHRNRAQQADKPIGTMHGRVPRGGTTQGSGWLCSSPLHGILVMLVFSVKRFLWRAARARCGCQDVLSIAEPPVSHRATTMP